jgi:galactose mutarotase-like enzyme
VLGDRARVTVEAPIAYGAEDEWLGALTIDPETDHLVVLFNLSATPEAETHGDVVARLKGRIAKGRGGPALT